MVALRLASTTGRRLVPLCEDVWVGTSRESRAVRRFSPADQISGDRAGVGQLFSGAVPTAHGFLGAGVATHIPATSLRRPIVGLGVGISIHSFLRS